MATQISEALERGQPPSKLKARPTLARGKRAKTSAQASPQRVEGIRLSAEVSRGPAQKTEPPTLVVDALHRGDHPTLTAALAAAKPGHRILVRPGLYQEGVVIDKPVEIIGDGNLGDVVVEAKGKNVILFKASMGRVANLTLRQAGDGQWLCVDIARGRLDLEGWDISSQSVACVGIRGGADPRLRRNRISKNTYEAIYIHDGGGEILEDNDLRGNAKGAWDVRVGCMDKVKRERNQE